jgi:regulator of protease activity HflC (stomatin/prohibitin superfamily)
MDTKEIDFKGFKMNGFLALFLILLLLAASIGSIIIGANSNPTGDILIALGIVFIVVTIVLLCGFIQLEPNEARVMVFFGNYRGTFRQTGLFWVNPFLTAKKLSLRARNLNAEPIKVNDKEGNPVMIGLVMVWRLKNTYKAMFEIDSQTMAESGATGKEVVGAALSNRMNAFEKFVKVQSDAALRQVASQFAYDNNDDSESERLTLRSGGDEINEQLVSKLNERLSMAGMEVVEARINYLAYAPEIAAVMLRRQQASAIISAREKIVEGAVSMVKMALDKLSAEEIVELDEEKKAAMVSNLLVVLCAEEPAQPVINSGTLNH